MHRTLLNFEHLVKLSLGKFIIASCHMFYTEPFKLHTILLETSRKKVYLERIV